MIGLSGPWYHSENSNRTSAATLEQLMKTLWARSWVAIGRATHGLNEGPNCGPGSTPPTLVKFPTSGAAIEQRAGTCKPREYKHARNMQMHQQARLAYKSDNTQGRTTSQSDAVALLRSEAVRNSPTPKGPEAGSRSRKPTLIHGPLSQACSHSGKPALIHGIPSALNVFRSCMS